MTVAGVLALVFWIGYFSFLLYGLILERNIVEAVNQARPAEKPLSLFRIWGDPWRVHRLYRAFYPSGDLLRKYWKAFGASGLCFAACVASCYYAVK